MKKRILSLLLLVIVAHGDFLRDNDNNIVFDTKTNLMWQDDNDAMTLKDKWAIAITYCKNKNLGGYTNWKLPNFNELYSIGDKTKSNPAIDSVFQNISISTYWTTTTYKDSVSNAWRINFDKGDSDYKSKTTNLGKSYIRCVRTVN